MMQLECLEQSRQIAAAGVGFGNHHAGFLLFHDLQRAFRAVGEIHFVVRLQDFAKALLNGGVVFDDEHAHVRAGAIVFVRWQYVTRDDGRFARDHRRFAHQFLELRVVPWLVHEAKHFALVH